MNKKLAPDKGLLIINIIALIAFIALCVFLTVAALPYVKQYTDNPEILSDFMRENLLTGILIFLAVQILQVVVAVIPGEFVEIAAGAAFGAFFGLILALIGVAAATSLIFLITRKLGKPLIYAAFGEKKMAALEKYGKHKRRDTVIFWLFFIPGLPKDLLTYAAPFFGISLPRFLFLTLTARIPSVLTSTVAAASIISGDYTTAVIIFAICGAVALVGWHFQDKIMKKL